MSSPTGQQLSLAELRAANEMRQREWDKSGGIDLSYRGNELAGEVGEACNIVKKLERERLGIRGSRATVEQLAEELADVVICVDLIAMAKGIDLGAAVVAKFNATSEKVGLATRLQAGEPLHIPDDWTPTATNINALPKPLFDYVAAIETKCDPANELRTVFELRQNTAALAVKVQELERERDTAQAKLAEAEKELALSRGREESRRTAAELRGRELARAQHREGDLRERLGRIFENDRLSASDALDAIRTVISDLAEAKPNGLAAVIERADLRWCERLGDAGCMGEPGHDGECVSAEEAVAEVKGKPAPAMHLPAQMSELRSILFKLDDELAVASAMVALGHPANTLGHDAHGKPVMYRDLANAIGAARLLFQDAMRLCPINHDDQQSCRPVEMRR